MSVISNIALLIPALFGGIALGSVFQKGFRPRLLIKLSKIVAVLSVLIIALSAGQVMIHGFSESVFWGFREIGISIRLDSVSLLMSGMISILAFVIIKFSENYLDGDPGQGAFMGRLAATIASVQLLVLSGNIGLLFVSWVFTSLALHRLLVFYKERPGAQIAAKKKFILARLGDISLLVALALLYYQYGTGNLEQLFTAIKRDMALGAIPNTVELTALFLALAAILKSAQFPTHGWLIEVMETPTPVSSLLHAGILNAGPFLIIRMSFVMDASTFAPLLLMSIGGFSALFASAAYLTQTSVKTALGYSSIGHMGFSLMVSGLGIYPAAMLHLVAHSFYKAHAFLSSGSAIEVIRGAKVSENPRKVSAVKVVTALALSLTLYAGCAMLWGIEIDKELPLFLVGGVIMLGLTRLFTSALSGGWNLKYLIQLSLLALLVTFSFFSLEAGTRFLIQSQVPEPTVPGTGKIIIGGMILALFAIAVFLQLLAPGIQQKPAYQTFAIHLKNGFYANAWFDRLINALQIQSEEESAEELHNIPDLLKQKIPAGIPISPKPSEKKEKAKTPERQLA